MGIGSRLAAAWRGFQFKGLGAETLKLLNQIYGSRESKSGQTVTAATAMDVSTVFACVRVLAEGVAQVPLKIYKEREGGKGADVATDHPLFNLLNLKPNRWQSSFRFRETMMIHLCLVGNFFAFKSKVRGQIGELIPIEPAKMAVERLRDYSLIYKVTGEDGTQRIFPQETILHLRGPSWNSWMGLEIVRIAREAIGLAMAAENAQAVTQRRGGRIPGVLAFDGVLTEQQYNDLTAWLKANALAAYDDTGLVIADRAAKFHSVAMSGVDQQTLETRRNQVEEVCREFRVMPIMVGHAGDKTPTYASAEQMFLAHVVHTLLPWYERLQQDFDIQLLGEREDGHYSKFVVNALMRGAFVDRTNAYAKALGAGGSPAWMEINEIRALEELNPVEWGKGKPEPPQPKPAPQSAPAQE